MITGKLESPDRADAVLYGYAYKGHWFWINDYGVDRRFFSVWKDYNCEFPDSLSQGKNLTDLNPGSQLNGWNDFTAYARQGTYANDPWGMTYDLIRGVQIYVGSEISGVLANSIFSE